MSNVYMMDEFQNITGDVVCRMFFGVDFTNEKVNGQPVTVALANLITLLPE